MWMLHKPLLYKPSETNSTKYREGHNGFELTYTQQGDEFSHSLYTVNKEHQFTQAQKTFLFLCTILAILFCHFIQGKEMFAFMRQ